MDKKELDKLPDESKYYIPTIEEFHVGFNYEIWEKKLVYDKVWKFRVNKYIFNEKQVTQTFFNYNFTEDLREGKIRVKLLDKEDIESLGFKFKTDLYVKDDLTLQVHKDSITIKYYDNFNNDSRTLVEQINIKTKDEFITLLKQLRIG